MRFVSLFAGVGGFDLGFERAGMTCVGQVEIDSKARAVLERHWPDVPKHDDVTTAIEWADRIGLTGRVDVVCGGFPCQDVSVAGKRAGLAGKRTGLFFDALAFAAHTQARVIVLENVPGLLSSNSGRDFQTVISSLADAGYRHIEWRVLDSQFFGVPQRRRRIFVVACRDTAAAGGRPVLAEREGMYWHPAAGYTQGQDAAAAAAGGFAGRGVVAALTRNGLGGGGPDDNLAQAGHLISQPRSTPAETVEAFALSQVSISSSPSAEREREPRLASSSSMQLVASTVTTGTGVRYDPDTESLVVT